MGLVPHLVQLHDKYAEKGFNILALTNDPKSTLDSFVKEKGINYPIGIGGGGAYGVSGIPQAYLVDVDGKVVWEGHPNSLSDAAIEAELAKVKFFPDLEYSSKFKNLLKAAQSKDYGKALKELGKIEEDKRASEQDKEHAAAVRTYFEELAGRYKAEAEEAAAAEDYYAASVAYAQLAEFEGLESAEAAEDKLKEWKKDKDIKKQLQAGALLEQGAALERAKNFKGALGCYVKALKLGTGTRYEGPARMAAQRLIDKGVR